ncbi:MAG: DivIVA domain-containing protein [Clostridia bacterium]
MMSPGELKDIQFDKAVFGGYDISAVDEVFAQVTADFTALFKENAVLKNKLKLLASTVEEYRGVDEAMRKALITAQNMANEMVKDAHAKSSEIIENASAIASARVTDLAAKISEEETHLKRAQSETAAFVDGIISAYNKQIDKIAAVRPDAPAEKVSVEDTLSLATDEINKCVASAIENIKEYQERAVITDVVESEESEQTEDVAPFKESVVSAKAEINFDIEEDVEEDTEDLKFGKNYDFDDE